MSASRGSSLKETKWAVSAKFLTLNVLVLLTTIRMMLMSALRVPWVCRACLRGS